MCLVSIIIPTFNSSKFISETILSIQSQTFSDWELIITDDCSTDCTVEIIKGYISNDSRISLFILSKNSGSGFARNNSISSAKGRFLAFCDSDDLWYPNKLELQLKYLSDLNLSFTFSSYVRLDSGGNKLGSVTPSEVFSYEDLLRNCPIATSTVIYDSNLLGKRFFPIMRMRQDYALWISIFKEIKSTNSMQEELVEIIIRKNSVSSNKVLAAYYHFIVLSKHSDLNAFLLGYNFLHYAFRAIRVYFITPFQLKYFK
jgi:teichuronic acid biosynthesis glycosyltransferase TuaG